MKKLACLIFVGLWLGASLAFAQQQPRYPVDPDTKWATGAKQKAADELKKQLAAGTEVLIIDVRAPASFEKEPCPERSTFRSISSRRTCRRFPRTRRSCSREAREV